MSARIVEIEDLQEENDTLRALLAERERDIQSRDRNIADRDDAIAARDEQLLQLARALKLTQEELDYLRKRFFGRKSEKHAPGPTLFDGLAAPETPPPPPAPDDEASLLSERERKQAKRRAPRRRPLPPDLPRIVIEYVLDEAERCCPDCTEPFRRIGEERSEDLEYEPAKFTVRVHVRGKYACPRHPEHGVRTPPAPPRAVPGSYAGPGLLAAVLVGKYDDHLPLYRQAEIFRRSGVDLARSTLCDWVGGATGLLAPVADAIRRSVLAGDLVQADETPVLLQDGPEGRPKDAYFWTYRSPLTREVFFDFRTGRGREGPLEALGDFRGTLQVDGYAGYDEVARRNALVVAACMAHARRKFHEALDSAPHEASLALVLFRRLYRVEERARDVPLEERARLRREESAPRMADLRGLIEKLAADAPPASRLGKACAYTLSEWERLLVFLGDPRVEIDNNAVERHIRSIAVGRNNWLFCGSVDGGRGAAIAYTLIESAKAAGVEPFAYLRDILQRLPGLPVERAAEFTPRAWAASRPR